MASSYPGPVTATQVGSYFVGQYYQVLKERPELSHQFYTGNSSMIRIDGDSNQPASTMMQIHSLLMSLSLTSIEVKTINSLKSWNGGIVVMVSGLVRTRDYVVRRKFVQTFFLAPQEKGFFVLNDIFQFFDEPSVPQHPGPIAPENKVEAQLNASSPIMESQVPHYHLEEDTREYVNPVVVEDNEDDEYSLPEQQQYEEVEQETVLENFYPEKSATSLHPLDTVQVASDNSADDLSEEPHKKTYASILRAARGQSAPVVTSLQALNRSVPVTSEWDYIQQPVNQPQNTFPYVEPVAGFEAQEDSFMDDEGLLKSVYVRNLPPNVTNADIEEVFRNFGTIRPDGVAIKLRKEIGVCYAFVEYEDLNGVHNAVKASPVQLAGRTVHVEERRANTAGGIRGGRRGRGRGGYQTEAPRARFGGQSFGRSGGHADSGDYGRPRGNGSYYSAS
ncbi:hypothetical protein MLD38_016041 [Melastoma candidum]|uniref:Uncharacterized protein n=1 Tax=Melastoma candidum TaxID=119954 RepID=A0ACB9RK11_9MYRT|nr:hypothetical protein MLD38_016041 [Melastoma candidum]